MISPIINGNFDHWTHLDFAAIGDTKPASATGGYWADRFGYRGAGSTVSPSRQKFTLGQTDIPGNPRYFHRLTVSSVTGTNNYALLAQDIPHVDTFCGHTTTLFFDMRCDTERSFSVEWQRNYGSGYASAPEVLGIPQKHSCGASWTRFKLVFNMPDIAGRFVGPNGDDYLTVALFFDAGSNFNSRTVNLGHQSGVFDIARFGWLPGDYSQHEDPFALLDTSTDMFRCLQFCQMGDGQESLMTGPIVAGGAYWSVCGFGVPMRATPVITLVNRGQKGFPANGSADSTKFGFNEYRVANATYNDGYFWSRWLADAEFPYTP